MRLFVLITLMLFGSLASREGFFPILQAASSDADVVIAECRKRTGLGEASCISLIQKHMTVERCQDYTDLSAKECEQRIKSLREDPQFQAKKAMEKVPPVAAPAKKEPLPTEASPVMPRNIRERILDAKREKEDRFNLIQEQTQALIEYVKRQGKDASKLAAALDEFAQKKQATLLAYDRYQSIAESTQSDAAFDLNGPREVALRVLRDTTEYYRTTLLPELQQIVNASP